jgi:uncharacterized DUF497 family protein
MLMQFEWDDAKAASNVAKHGIAFEEATRAFLDPERLIADDERRDYGERRIRILGKVDDRVLLVVCTWRSEVCRLISARKANAREKRRYDSADARSS